MKIRNYFKSAALHAFGYQLRLFLYPRTKIKPPVLIKPVEIKYDLDILIKTNLSAPKKQIHYNFPPATKRNGGVRGSTATRWK